MKAEYRGERTRLFLLLLLLACPPVRAEIRATIHNGLDDTTTPLVAGFVRILLENGEAKPARVTVSIPMHFIEQEVDLPAGSRKEIPFVVHGNERITIRQGSRVLESETVLPISADINVVVIATRSTGLERLARDPLNATGAGTMARAGIASTSATVRVYYTPPSRLPPTPYAYPPGHLLLIAHPGGYESMSAQQADALRITATLANTILVTEGKAQAFQGTPLEGLVPGTEKGVTSFSDWPAYFPGSTKGSSALTLFDPAADGMTSVIGDEQFPLQITRKRAVFPLICLPFDYTAAPLRSIRTQYWNRFIDDILQSYDPVQRVLRGSFPRGLLQRRLSTPPDASFQVAVLIILALGYAAAVIGSRSLRKNPQSTRSWVVAPLILYSVLLVGWGASRLIRKTAPPYFELSLSRYADNGLMTRRGLVGVTSREGWRNVMPSSRFASVMAAPHQMNLGARVSLSSHVPPVLREFSCKQTSVAVIPLDDIVETFGIITIFGQPAGSGWDLLVHNESGKELTSVHFVFGSQHSLVSTIPPGKNLIHVEPVNPTPPSSVGTTLGLNSRGPLPEEQWLRETLVTLTAGTATPKRPGFAVARFDLPPQLPGPQSKSQYIYIPVTAQ